MLNEIDLSRADLNLLTLFEVVLRERHVGRAAEKLNLSPSAISHGLGRLRRLLNDPLFMRTPKGMVPTERAIELAGPVADILARVRQVVSTAEPFDPATSTRRFTIGAPDGVTAVFLPPLLEHLSRFAPGIDISLRQLLPQNRSEPTERAWEATFTELETRVMDIAVAPLDDIPARFAERVLYEEDFVLAMRRGHPFAGNPSLDHYCAVQHLVVSMTGDPHGFIDLVLAGQGLSRRVALTAPSFLMALGVVAESDVVAAVPRRFMAIHARHFGVVGVDVPTPLPKSRIRAIAPKAGLMDAGVAWLFEAMPAV